MADTAMSDRDKALDNLRKMFRLTMAANFREKGETLESCRARLVAHPATAQVAQKLGCTVEELLTGFGQDEVLHTAPGYDHAREVQNIEAVLERIKNAPVAIHEGELAEDGHGRSGTQQGKLAAPKAGETRSEIRATHAADADLLKQQLQGVRGKMASGTAARPRKKPKPGKP